LAKQGVAPTTVLVFLGKPVQYITTEPEDSIAAQQQEALDSMAATSKELQELGVRMEVCGSATKHFGVDNASLLPGMDAVGNGFISLIGWQTKGYVPMTF
jgi:intracellular sulfur oxidation DsrE/DsrF family protein